jgi:cellulose biosynthesis protein BcsQ
MGKIITFYSYKGGTGRSMALANVAWLLASNGMKVCVVDWDLEAPGLHRYFKPFLVDHDLFATDGLIDAFWRAAGQAFTPAKGDSSEITLRKFTLDTLDVDLEDYITPLDWDFGASGGIDFIGAGRQGATYSERVNTFDWGHFYSLGGGGLLDEVRELMASSYDFVLIDSRTGVSDTSGICTIQMPDTLVGCFTLNRQSIDGAAAILRSVRAQRSAQSGRTGIMLLPIVTRIENSEKDKLELARVYARKAFADLLPKGTAEEERRYWDDMKVTYRPYYAYEEVLAAFGDTAGSAGSSDTLLAEMEVIARRITGLPDLRAAEMPERDRQRVRQACAFGVLAARSNAPAIDPEAADEVYALTLRNIFHKERLWRSSNYRYKYLLSKTELRLIGPDQISKFGPLMRDYHDNSEIMITYQNLAVRNFYRFYPFFVLLVAASISLVIWPKFNSFKFGLWQAEWYVLYAMCGLLFAAFCVYVAGQRQARAPVGVTATDAITLSMLGPFATAIRDYNPGKSE